MEREKLKVFEIYSTIEDRHIEKNLNDSPIWKNCNHLEDLESGFTGFVYKISFDGLTPVHVNKIEKFNLR